MIHITKTLALHTDVHQPTEAQWEWITSLPEVLQKKLDPVVVAELGWRPMTAFNKYIGQHTRRMWAAGALGTVGNLTAARFLEDKGVDWLGVLFDEQESMGLAA